MSSPTASSPAPKMDRKTRVYEVSSLDTIHSIALKFKMTTGELLRLNGLPSTYRIYSGQHLTVFENSTSGAPEVTTRASIDRPAVGLDELTSLGNLGSLPQGADGSRPSVDKSSGALSGSNGSVGETSTSSLSTSNPSLPTIISPNTSSMSSTSTSATGSRTTANQGAGSGLSSPAPRLVSEYGQTLSPGASPTHHRHLSSTDLKMSFTNVITPTYKSVPLLVLMRQARDKNYFGDGKIGGASGTQAAGAGVSDSLTATMAKQSPSHPARLMSSSSAFLSISEELRLSSRDLVKEHVRYYINEQRNVFGELTLTPNSIFFEPALDDPVTRQLGLLSCQIQCDLKDILDVHIIEASEVLGWWKTKAGSPSSPQTTHSPSVSSNASASGSPSSSSTSSPPQTRKPRTLSHSGPSSTHLTTGNYGSNGSTRNSPSASPGPQIDSHRLLDDSADRSPRFLQLTVLMGKPSDGGTQTGKIVYFLINRQSIDLFYQKLEIWCAQARPSTTAGGSGPRKPSVSSILSRPQDKHHQHHQSDRDRHNSSPAPFDGSAKPESSSSNAAAEASKTHSYVVADAEIPTLNLPSALLTNDVTLQRLAGALPTRLRHSDWTLLYSTERHGVSLTTFFNKTKRKGPSYLVIEDDAGFRFGAFISDSWEPQRSYYGTGECFLFTLYPSFNIYPWSQLNEYFIYSKEDTIALGGGSGKFALWLDADLMQGSSAPCDTFLNSTLSCQEDFKPVIVEVWGFNDVIKP